MVPCGRPAWQKELRPVNPLLNAVTGVDRPSLFLPPPPLVLAINSPSRRSQQIAQADDRKVDELIGSGCGK